MKTSRKYSSPSRGFDFSCVYFSMFLYNFCYLFAVIFKVSARSAFLLRFGWSAGALDCLLGALGSVLVAPRTAQERPESRQEPPKTAPRPLPDLSKTASRSALDLHGQPQTLSAPCGALLAAFWLPFRCLLIAFLHIFLQHDNTIAIIFPQHSCSIPAKFCLQMVTVNILAYISAA